MLHSLWWMLVLIGVMIMIHELGHYWAARYFDVKVEAFSFGFGPRLIGFRRGETDFRISAILFGGYVKMAGEQPGDPQSDDPRSFLNKPRWQRLIIAFAGPFMNIVLAVALLTGLYMVKYPKLPDSSQPGTIGVVLADSAAAAAGLREGDRVIAFDGQNNPTWEDILLKEIASANRQIPVTVLRDGKEINLTVTPKLDERNGIGTLGWAEQSDVMISGVEPGMDAERQGLRGGDMMVSVNGIPIRSAYRLREVIKASKGAPVEVAFLRDGKEQTVTVTPTEKTLDDQSKAWMIGVALQPRVTYVKLGFGEALTESVSRNLKSATLIFQMIKGIVEQRMSAKSLEGPIRIAQISGEAAKEGPAAFLDLMSVVSLNLAVLNLLPIPILDGGMILLLLIEMLYRRDLSLQFKENVMKFGFVFLMMLVVFVLYNDITKVLTRG
ncbi:MAG: RIP metalloprotease RseP [Bryobacteraceae bacterium]